MRVRLLAVATACLTLGGSASAGIYAPPPGDQFPAWTADGGSLVYVAGNDDFSLHVVRPDGSDDRRLAPLGRYSRFALAPNGLRIAYTGFESPEYRLVVIDGQRHHYGPASAGSRPAWSPDGRRVAFVRQDALAVADTATGTASALAAGQFAEPAWSPDGRSVAVVDRDGLKLVDAATGAVAALARAEPCCFGPPAWAPDGSRIAVVDRAGGAFGLRLVAADGSGSTAFPLARTAPSGWAVHGLLVWTADSRSLLYAGSSSRGSALYRLDVLTGSIARLLPLGAAGTIGLPGQSPALSPDGTRLAFEHGGECRDRVGIYVTGVDGRGLRRLTNSCRIAGTARADRLAGTPLADVLAGLGGDDRLQAVDPGYMGDTLEGGAGDDTLLGAYRQDLLDGGPGNDRLSGGPSGDLLIGGPGRDTIAAEGGLDVVDARDGARDTVSCGTSSRTTTPERDTAYVDRVDRVDRDCELVLRRERPLS